MAIGVIMAGGEGSRLRPLTCGIPKPMVPVLGKPVMEYSVELLKKHGINRACVTLQYLPHRIMDHFGEGSDFGVNLEYFVEEQPLGTAGSVKNAAASLKERTVIVSGDALTDIDLGQALKVHEERKSRFTIVLKRVSCPLEYGVVIVNREGVVQRFLEKPSWGEVFSDTVNTGIYILEPEILDLIPENTFFDFSKDLFPLMMKRGIPIHGVVADGYWCDIGDSKQYMQAQFDLLDGKVQVELPMPEKTGRIYIEEGATVEESAVLEEPCFIGAGTVIGGKSRIGPYSVIGRQCRLQSATVKRSIVWDSVEANLSVALRGTVVCDRVRLGRGVSAFEECMIGSDSTVGEHSEIRPGIRIWPGKSVEAESVVSQDVIWSQAARKGLFGDLGIRGVINTDITPELAVAVGSAYSNVAKGHAAVGYNRHCGGEMLSHALSSGLMSGGVSVHDAGECPLPVLRYGVRTLHLGGGVFVRCDGFFASLHLLDEMGADITRETERKVENAYFRRDGRRCEYDRIQYEHDLNSMTLFYIRHLVGACENLANTRLKIGVGGESGEANVFREIMSQAGVQTVELKEQLCSGLLRREVREEHLDMGVIFGEDGGMSLLTHEGEALKDSTVKALKYYLVALLRPYGKVFLPVHESDELEGFIKGCGCRVERVKTHEQDQMRAIWQMHAPYQERELYFSIMYDPIAFAVRLMSLLTKLNQPLQRIADLMPAGEVQVTEVPCPMQYKGQVIRTLSEQGSERKELLDGVKIYHKEGWVLVLPHQDKPACRIYTGAFKEEYARELSLNYADLIKKIAAEQGG